MNTRRRRVRGFTLLEVMVAGAILVAATTGVVASLGAVANQYAHQRHLSRAIYLADGEIERLLLRYRNDPIIRDGVSQSRVDGPYTIRWRTEGNTPVPRVRTIHVTVSWLEQGRTRKVSMSTMRP